MAAVVTDCCGVRPFDAQANAKASGSHCRMVPGHVMTAVNGRVDRCNRHHRHCDDTAVYGCVDAYAIRLRRVRIGIW